MGNLAGIAPGRTISVGTWGNKSEHVGLWYNLETLFVNRNGAYGGRVSAAYIMNASELSKLNSFIISHDAYSAYANNCSTFASGAWNTIAPPVWQISAGVPNTPKNLAGNIKAKLPYSVGAAVPYYYNVYFAQGAGAPKLSSTMHW